MTKHEVAGHRHDEGGGGASRSTDPAQGSSSATDVSLREFVTLTVAALDRHLTAEIATLRREAAVANNTAERAIEVAALEAKERLQAHNGLIEQNRTREEINRQAQEKAAATFVTRETVEVLEKHLDEKIHSDGEAVQGRLARIERFQATLTGAVIFAVFIGAASLLKVIGG